MVSGADGGSGGYCLLDIQDITVILHILRLELAAC